ncbi:Predicted transcriptional regulator [Mycobacteroides abscessus subsp. abscessus]|uniref:hypothetical protein n=1 Tax=Mycobacteroides abscessus TaxID=36809 RepID=UPI0009263FB1|nr:hypothetical protein [Mycobacteroides abscessus]SHU93416.1 Predicted transcriptional regulator [Mycobacteroides abscessus subsp. abscessus]SHX73096.1 Predicted transcriptional regulator [Mycobacteroides abscessus subsp. abscessus]SIG86873.1 Predicted transcriptional regulator [Mycobacteroides abscessus subsp. abscessus]SKD18819.1 Predicted transcriptional regulator [Mycobacteroides abscessus subsp. abscessus]SKN10218.1 Predicted transcriptional regulator [Mycobacteroides abscessus subsp. ab
MAKHDMRYLATKYGQSGDDDNDLLTASQVSQMTGVPVSTLHEYAVRVEAGLEAHGPVHVRLGPRRRRWLRRDVSAWVEGHRVVGNFSPQAPDIRHLASAR